jgi:hypothetical protein
MATIVDAPLTAAECAARIWFRSRGLLWEKENAPERARRQAGVRQERVD